ncbi:hypothetical protein [Paenibacillus sp. NPDC058174]|uniref:hypothetical protein n=1 Tax=Paenibacillus sp. NPDC058174 TaxID=3346366 RepID=UPI0036D8CD78
MITKLQDYQIRVIGHAVMVRMEQSASDVTDIVETYYPNLSKEDADKVVEFVVRSRMTP